MVQMDQRPGYIYIFIYLYISIYIDILQTICELETKNVEQFLSMVSSAE
jgi:hypothetical protein